MTLETFNFPYNRSYEFNIEYKTQVDEAYTAHEQRCAQWLNSRLSLILEFAKDDPNTKDIIAFFKRHKGRFKAFNFVWAFDKGGDGNTYKMRFDTDKFTGKIRTSSGSSISYSTFTLPIIEVRTDE